MSKKKIAEPVWLKKLPLCAVALYDPYQHKTAGDMAWTIRIELDLIESGEDGTSRKDRKPLMNWLKKFAPDVAELD